MITEIAGVFCMVLAVAVCVMAMTCNGRRL